MTLEEAKKVVRGIISSDGYEGKLTDDAIEDCARVYLSYWDDEYDGPNERYLHGEKGCRKTNLTATQWLLVRTHRFKDWFGNSVLVDENGEPKVMWHGSSKEFKEFKAEAIKVRKSLMTLWSGPGFYFTDSKRTAMIYAKGGVEPMEVFLRLENPLVVDETGCAENRLDHITKRQAEKIFLDGDNTQWLDHGLANELERMTDGAGGKVRDKRWYKSISRAQRVMLYVAMLKTDVVKLKAVSKAYGAKSQSKMLKSICKHTGHDGVIHTIAPGVVEYVVYDPMAIKSAVLNNGEYSRRSAVVMDGWDGYGGASVGISLGIELKGLIAALRRIACMKLGER